jgi:ATP-binding cassette subfamily C (CFTR/MRP) protein 1
MGHLSSTSSSPVPVISALLRIAEPTSGRILIDDVDIHTVGLHLLRSSLSVISQDAVLLAGTIRYNLDPFQGYDDIWLHQCLQRVGLVDSQPGTPDASSPSGLEKIHDSDSGSCIQGLTLDSEVKENGVNLSHGQRSLVSIARALVRRSRIVILDEATASIDGRADTEIQAMLSKVMGDATVLSVAHRLDTIVAMCDRVVVMDSGRIVEVGSVPELYSRPDGLFRGLCRASNITIPG